MGTGGDGQVWVKTVVPGIPHFRWKQARTFGKRCRLPDCQPAGLPRWMIFVFLIVGVNFHSIGAEGPTNHAPVATLSLLDAVRTTVLQDPGIKIQETEVNAARGRSQQAKGFFDYRLQSSVLRSVTQDVQRYFATNTIPVLLGFKAQRDTNGNLILFRGKPIFDPIIANIYPTNFTRQTINETEFRLALEKLTRSGISFSPSIRLTRLDSSTELPNPDNRADMGLLIRIPLARGLGRKAVTAGETSARLEMEATQLMLRHIVSARVLNTVTAYWGFRAAQERLAILTESEGKALELRQSDAAAQPPQCPLSSRPQKGGSSHQLRSTSGRSRHKHA